MKYTIIILVLSIVLFLVACRSNKKMNQSTSDLKDPMIQLFTSSCFGKCKVYKLKIYEDRTVSYEGIKNVEKIGIYKSKITDSDYQSLIDLFEAINFQKLDSSYLTGVRDKQKFTLGYSQKEVKYQKRAASAELKAITKKIEQIEEEMKWEQN